MISSKESGKLYWSEASSWCAKYNTGWYMPSLDDMKDVKTQYSKIQGTLNSSSEYQSFSGDYWTSSTSLGRVTFNISTGKETSWGDGAINKARAILAF